MPTRQPYQLIAYDVETRNEVLNCPHVGSRFSDRPFANDTVFDNDQRLFVVGVLDTSTEKLWKIDVRKL